MRKTRKYTKRRDLKWEEKQSQKEQKTGQIVDRKEKDNYKYKGKTLFYWTDEDHQKLYDGLFLYGKDWDKVAAHVKNRSIHAIKFQAHNLRARISAEPYGDNLVIL